jgi:electron transfer flavoprotein beta subunit
MKQLQIIVCIKQVPDPEGHRSAYVIDSDAKKVIPTGIAPVINPFDENALEAALQLKDILGGKVVAISLGWKLAKPVLRKALSVGVEELILLEDENFKDINGYSTATVLAAAIKKIGEYDLIFTGRQAADWDFGQVGLVLAEILQVPCVNLAQKVNVEDNNVVVEKLKRNGYEIVKVSMPALITVSNEVGDLRLPTLQAIRAAHKQSITIWNSKDLEVDPVRLEGRKIWKLFAPQYRIRDRILIEGESPEQKGENLAIWMKKEQII